MIIIFHYKIKINQTKRKKYFHYFHLKCQIIKNLNFFNEIKINFILIKVQNIIF